MLRGNQKINLEEIDKVEPIDPEIRELIDMINNVEGIETTSSCCGHNKMPAVIYCIADSIADVHKFMYDYFYCNSAWKFILYITDAMIDENTWDKVEFYFESVAEICDTKTAIENLTKTFKKLQDSPKNNQQLKVIKEQ